MLAVGCCATFWTGWGCWFWFVVSIAPLVNGYKGVPNWVGNTNCKYGGIGIVSLFTAWRFALSCISTSDIRSSSLIQFTVSTEIFRWRPSTLAVCLFRWLPIQKLLSDSNDAWLGSFFPIRTFKHAKNSSGGFISSTRAQLKIINDKMCPITKNRLIIWNRRKKCQL